MVDVFLKRAGNNKKDKFGRFSLKASFSARSWSRAEKVFWECGGSTPQLAFPFRSRQKVSSRYSKTRVLVWK